MSAQKTQAAVIATLISDALWKDGLPQIDKFGPAMTSLIHTLADATVPKGTRGNSTFRDTREPARKGYRLVGVWDDDGHRFRTYGAENLDGVEMYVKDKS